MGDMRIEYLEDVRKQAKMLLDPKVSVKDYLEFKICRIESFIKENILVYSGGFA